MQEKIDHKINTYSKTWGRTILWVYQSPALIASLSYTYLLEQYKIKNYMQYTIYSYAHFCIFRNRTLAQITTRV